LVMRGAPNDLSSTTLRPLGPSVTRTALARISTLEEVFSQRKRPESGRYLLQVDRQTKGSYKTSEAAQVAGREIKAAYPIVQVSI
jgi:hypothetical protein